MNEVLIFTRTLESLNPIGTHLLNWRRHTKFIRINDNESGDAPNYCWVIQHVVRPCRIL